jgi:Zn-dependent protease with chaperone function
MKRYTVTLMNSVVSMMTEEELLAVIGHELGHIKCAHMANKTMGSYLVLLR